MRILFVAFSQSLHTVRWIRQIADQGWDLHLFPSSQVWSKVPYCHPDLRGVTIYGPSFLPPPRDIHPSVRLAGYWGLPRGGRFVARMAKRALPALDDPVKRLCRLVRRLQPDLVHSLEIQHAGYLAMKAKKILKERFPPWIVTNWGSDIYFYGKFAEHKPLLVSTLSSCDYYSCECLRDVDLGFDFGFTGEVLPVLPNTGGFDLERLAQLRSAEPTSRRRLIVVKGYQNVVGRSLTGLRALRLCADLLKGYRIAIYFATEDVIAAARLLASETGIRVDIMPYTPNHEDMLRLHGQARISIGLSISDGISTSFLEALAMGSFPIQSDTSAAHEWVQNGRTGFVVQPEDPHEVAAALRRALADDGLVDRAAEENLRTAQQRLSYSAIKAQVISTYRGIQQREEFRQRKLPRHKLSSIDLGRR